MMNAAKFFATGFVLFMALEQSGRSSCVAKFEPGPLAGRAGFLEFINPTRWSAFKSHLPTIEDPQIQNAFQSSDTMWYDEASMIFLYQDSQESVVGGRANCVGRDVGERNSSNPDIAKLTNYFGSDYRFKFPFRTAAGTDDSPNVQSINFWVPPRQNGKPLPVKVWQESARGRWHWIFPVGTLLGEILFEQSSDGQWYPFEVRSRIRYHDGWAVNAYRPYRSATELSTAIKTLRPTWSESPTLSAVVAHLENSQNLVASQMVSDAFGKVFDRIQGAIDVIPSLEDEPLVKQLLGTTFRSVEGHIWKQGRGLETYAPGSSGKFSIVPANYKMGLIPVNEVSCNRCHIETGRPLGHFDSAIVLYGEVWGEDRIFTWHPFKQQSHIFSTWDDSDVSREINNRMVDAGLVVQSKPTAGDDALYHSLPTPF